MADNISFRCNQFKLFYNLLMQNAPEGFVPWLIVCQKKSKAVDPLVIASRAPNLSCCNVIWVKKDCGTYKKTVCPICNKGRASWHQTWARVVYQQALGYIYAGYNIGLAARSFDNLALLDGDTPEAYAQLPANTLLTRSRSRQGGHAIVWAKLDNLPTENDGEIRADDQYVLIPGSYVPTESEDPLAGFYTVERALPVREISLDEVPAFYKREQVEKKAVQKNTPIDFQGDRSALFKLEIKDIIQVSRDRVAHPWHETPSKTDANFSIENGLAHCWRHSVSLNALQLLVVKSGYMSCSQAGTGHKDSHASQIIGDDGAIYHAWVQAKKDNLIPENDPMPTAAMRYVAKENNLIEHDFTGMLPARVYNKVIELVDGA